MLTGAVALKEDDLQFVSNQVGDVPADNPGGLGLYYRDTRFLNQFELSINGAKPVFLSNSANKRYIATFQFINPAFTAPNGSKVKQQTISTRRSRFLTGEALYERIGFLNCNHFDVELDVVLALDADFRDIFSIRGFKAQLVAGNIAVTFGGEDVVFSYQGRDEVKRRTEVTFSRAPEAISPREVRFRIKLGPRQFDSIVVRVQPQIGRQVKRSQLDFDRELDRLSESYRKWDESSTGFSTSNELFDRELLRASRYDIRTLIQRTPYGLIPDAGVPWYGVPFGRDAIITSLQTLLYNPAIAEGTLRFLAANQGKEQNPFTEEEPGKIMHELRRGELAHLKEVPHTPYFGTVDATPLFLVLFVEAMNWVGSDRLYDDILPHAFNALEWIDRWGDVDGDGFVEYIAHRSGGIVNLGWKDSSDAIQYDDGTPALPPLALVEVQGYVYQAKMGMAGLLHERGRQDLAHKLETEAAKLREKFNRDFWLEEEGFYAQALDGEKRAVRSISSNVGHCLWSGICDSEKAQLVAHRLLAPDMFSGWGIRTLSADSSNYNPMSYHNGTVWPHDTALIALGLRRSGFADSATRVAEAMIEAGLRFTDGRLPELFCGFSRDHRFNSSPAAYIISCSPQAWAAGAVFMLLQTLLDLQPDIAGGTLKACPILPQLFSHISMRNIRLGRDRMDLMVEGAGEDVEIQVNKQKAREMAATSAG